MLGRVEIVDWTRAAGELLGVRYAVFVDEQHVPIELEQDGLEPSAAAVVSTHISQIPQSCPAVDVL